MREQIVRDQAGHAATAVDLAMDRLFALTAFCASSPSLTKHLDFADFRANCGRYAAMIDAWAVVVEIGDLHRQLLNTRTDAPDVLPIYPREEEERTLLALERRTQATGSPALANVFPGLVHSGGVLTVGQWIRLGDGRAAMLYVGSSVESISGLLEKTAEGSDLVFSVLDPSRRIVARSADIESNLFADAPSWMRGALDGKLEGTVLGQSEREEIGGVWDAGFRRLRLAPDWMVVAERPAPKLAWFTPVFLEQSGLVLLGVLCSLLIFWFVTFRDRAAQRFASLSEKRFEAERQSRQKSRLLASVAHDIRSPLISLIGALEMMREGRTSGPKALDVARGSAEALLQLLDDILELSFLGSNEFTFNTSPVDLSRLAEDVLSPFEADAERKGLSLDLEVSEGLPIAVSVDRLRLQQVLSNLVSNAVKYTETGGVTLYVSAKINDDEMSDVTFAITDSGVGIEKEDIPRILQEFGRLDRDLDRREEGTGLGLAICQRILNAMGSSLSVESMPGQGSTFSFRMSLPVVSQSLELESMALPLKGILILYAEDDPIIRNVTTTRLTEAGATVVAVGDGAKAISRLKNMTPDLLLLDLRMPGLDGIAAIRRLRTSSQTVTYPIFVLTSHIASQLTAEARALGVDAVFTKPVQIRSIAAALAAWRGDTGKHVPLIGDGSAQLNGPLVEIQNFRSAVNTESKGAKGGLFLQCEDAIRADLVEMKNAFADSRISKAGELAHRCSGLCQVIGASRLANRLRDFELSAEENDTAEMAELQTEIEWLFEATFAEMRNSLCDRSIENAESDRCCL